MPLGTDTLAGREFGWAKRRDVSRGKGEHPGRSRVTQLQTFHCECIAASERILGLGCRMFIEDQDAMGLQVVVARKSIAGKEVVHRFIKLQS